MNRRVVGLFAKPPVAGRVKTRLSPPLTAGEAAALYRAFLGDIAETLASGADWDWVVFSTDPAAQRESWPGDAPLPESFRPQRGDDLGARMNAALTELLEEGYTSAVLVGSDHPTLDEATLAEAFTRLERAEVVFGPSLDGGYFLVGLNLPRPELFREMTWSHDRVLADTLDRVRAAGIQPSFLPPWYDVDTVEDLAFLRIHLEALTLQDPEAETCPRTRAALRRLPPVRSELPGA